MASSGGQQGPLDTSAGGNLTGTTTQDVNALLFSNRASSSWTPLIAAGSQTDGVGGANNLSVGGFLYNGATWDRARTPNVFKTQSFNTAGAGTVWTPTAGKKFRLMRFQLMFTDDASLAVAATQTYELRDSGTGVGIRYDVFLPGAAGTALGSFETPWVDLGNGILSAAANNVLQLNIPTNLAAGVIRINVAGTEE